MSRTSPGPAPAEPSAGRPDRRERRLIELAYDELTPAGWRRHAPIARGPLVAIGGLLLLAPVAVAWAFHRLLRGPP